jgi:hypothetical protein
MHVKVGGFNFFIRAGEGSLDDAHAWREVEMSAIESLRDGKWLKLTVWETRLKEVIVSPRHFRDTFS